MVNSDAGIREAECEKSAMDVKYSTDTKIEDNSRMYKLQKAHFDQEINTAVGFCYIMVALFCIFWAFSYEKKTVVSLQSCKKKPIQFIFGGQLQHFFSPFPSILIIGALKNTREFQIKICLFCQFQKAESQLAYELQAAKIRQKIRNEEIQIDIVERRKQIEIECQEVERKDRELQATVKLPADAENYRVQQIAEGKRTQTIESAKADAERIKKLGMAEASAIELIGKAEAERMRMKAMVYKQYGDAAIMNIVLESLPKVCTLNRFFLHQILMRI